MIPSPESMLPMRTEYAHVMTDNGGGQRFAGRAMSIRGRCGCLQAYERRGDGVAEIVPRQQPLPTLYISHERNIRARRIEAKDSNDNPVFRDRTVKRNDGEAPLPENVSALAHVVCGNSSLLCWLHPRS